MPSSTVIFKKPSTCISRQVSKMKPNQIMSVCYIKCSTALNKPCAWYQRFATFTIRVGFKQSNCDSALFIHHSRSGIRYLRIYVDDILLTASSTALRDPLLHLSMQNSSWQISESFIISLASRSNTTMLVCFCNKRHMPWRFYKEQTCQNATLAPLQRMLEENSPTKEAHRCQILHYIEVMLVLSNILPSLDPISPSLFNKCASSCMDHWILITML